MERTMLSNHGLKFCFVLLVLLKCVENVTPPTTTAANRRSIQQVRPTRGPPRATRPPRRNRATTPAPPTNKPTGGKSASWSYKDPDGDWGDAAKLCSYQYQSPINLLPSLAVPRPDYLTPIIFGGYSFARGAEYVLKNNGHTAQVDVRSSTPPTIEGAALGATYRLAQFHFHWGLTNNRGSEHEVNGMAYPLELHLVHYKAEYGDLGTAANKPDGLAVLGIFFKIGNRPNEGLQKVIDYFPDIKFKDQKVTIETFPLGEMLPRDRLKYWRYEGSLTTPPCYESVTWTLFSDTTEITERQVEAFRSLMENSENEKQRQEMGDNFRPRQPLNQRVVQASWDRAGGGGVNFAKFMEALELFNVKQ